jgi:hypothetical protein
MCVCAMYNKISKVRNLNETDILLMKLKLKLRENHSGAAKPRKSTIQKTKIVQRQ